MSNCKKKKKKNGQYFVTFKDENQWIGKGRDSELRKL